MKLSEMLDEFFSSYDGYDGDIVGSYRQAEWIKKAIQLEAENAALIERINYAMTRAVQAEEENEQLRALFRPGDADALLADTKESG